jgi:hypothetical protein
VVIKNAKTQKWKDFKDRWDLYAAQPKSKLSNGIQLDEMNALALIIRPQIQFDIWECINFFKN